MPLDLNLNSHFALNPTNIDISRSTFKRTHRHLTTANLGDLIPIYADSDILPGDSFSIDTTKLIRTMPLVAPIFDNIVCDVFWFAVPWRLVWNHTKEFFGENTSGPWTQTVEYTIPKINSPESTGWDVHSIASHMGIRMNTPGLTVNALNFRAYALICNEWFRSQVVSDPLNIPVDDTTQTGTNGSNYINDVANGGAMFKVARAFDYFSGALPSPQRGEAVAINLAGLSGTIPVAGNGYGLALTDGTYTGVLRNGPSNFEFNLGNNIGDLVGDAANPSGAYSGTNNVSGVLTLNQLGNNPEYSGLIGDLSSVSGESLITINELRQAFQIQKYFEKLGRGGGRYREYIKSMFGVTSPDARMQVPEYLGGSRFEININSIYQSSESGTTPQGNAAAYSVTADNHHDFTFSFTEHCCLIGLMCLRRKPSYQQGIARQWTRTTVLDLYNPLFANLGERPIRNDEIYAQGSSVIDSDTNKPYDEEVFGYQEAWAEYRYTPNYITGMMNSDYAQSLDMWHLADDYSQLPSLSDEWIREDPSVMDRVLAVSSSESDQFMIDVYFDIQATRPMPVYSIPGLIDHH